MSELCWLTQEVRLRPGLPGWSDGKVNTVTNQRVARQKRKRRFIFPMRAKIISRKKGASQDISSVKSYFVFSLPCIKHCNNKNVSNSQSNHETPSLCIKRKSFMTQPQQHMQTTYPYHGPSQCLRCLAVIRKRVGIKNAVIKSHSQINQKNNLV